MGISASITSVDGAPSMIGGQHVTLGDQMSVMLNNSNTSSISPTVAVGTPNRDFILFEGDGNAIIAFASDSSLDDGQGFKIQGSAQAEITAVSGSVYFIPAKFINYADSISDIYDLTDRITCAAGTIVGCGCVLCDKNGSFSIKLKTCKTGGSFMIGGANSGTQAMDIWIASDFKKIVVVLN